MTDIALPRLGLYEKALPAALSWRERLETARALGFDFVEMSVDESDTRLERLDWSRAERRAFRTVVEDTGVAVPSVCLSAHRRFPFGSADPAIREEARRIMRAAVDFAVDTGVRTLQLAGYDVYYEPSTHDSRRRFEEGLRWAAAIASQAQVMIAVEIMDTPYMGSITRWRALTDHIRSPWFQVYPDLGNLTAWCGEIDDELALGIDRIVAVHLKDTLPVGPNFPGRFRSVPFGAGCVDFTGAFAALKRLGYDGAFLVEMWAEDGVDAAKAVADARAYLVNRMIEGGLGCRSTH